MKRFFTTSIFCTVVLLYATIGNAQMARYWVGNSVYQNNFSTTSELNEWTLMDDNGSGSWSLSGNGTAILTMDNALGSFANRVFNESGGIPNLVPLDAVNGSITIQVVGLTGGNQQFFVQAREFESNGTYITEQTILSAQNTIGSFTVPLNTFSWNALTTQIMFIIGGQNMSSTPGAIEIGYFNYNNTDNSWSNTANWSATSGGTGGASVPGVSDTAHFDLNSGNCIIDVAVAVSKLTMSSSYSSAIMQGSNSFSVGNGGAVLNGGSLIGGSGDMQFDSIILAGTTLQSTSSTLSVRGNFNFTSGSFLHNEGMVEFNGTTLQLLSSNTEFSMHHITVNNATGVSLNSPLSSDGVVFLQQGVFNTNSDTLDLGTDGTLVELMVAPTSYVEGYIRVERNIGSIAGSQSFGGIGLTITEPLFPVNPTVVVRETGVITKIGGIKRYFDIKPTINTGLSASLEFRYFESELGDVNEVALALFKAPLPFNNADPQWIQQNTAVFNITSNSITVNGVTDFSRWTAATIEGLPTELLSFTVSEESGNAQLQWVAAGEKGSYFILSKSVDGVTFTEFASISTVDNGAVLAAYQYSDKMDSEVSYYRLAFVDENGVLQYSKIISVKTNSSFAFNAYPEDGALIVKLTEGSPAEGSSLHVVDALGHTVYSGVIQPGSSEARVRLSVYSGIYIITMQNGQEYTSKKINMY